MRKMRRDATRTGDGAEDFVEEDGRCGSEMEDLLSLEIEAGVTGNKRKTVTQDDGF